jgi:hypothetical protein
MIDAYLSMPEKVEQLLLVTCQSHGTKTWASKVQECKWRSGGGPSKEAVAYQYSCTISDFTTFPAGSEQCCDGQE